MRREKYSFSSRRLRAKRPVQGSLLRIILLPSGTGFFASAGRVSPREMSP
jgi:hypothetical protein